MRRECGWSEPNSSRPWLTGCCCVTAERPHHGLGNEMATRRREGGAATLAGSFLCSAAAYRYYVQGALYLYIIMTPNCIVPLARLLSLRLHSFMRGCHVDDAPALLLHDGGGCHKGPGCLLPFSIHRWLGTGSAAAVYGTRARGAVPAAAAAACSSDDRLWSCSSSFSCLLAPACLPGPCASVMLACAACIAITIMPLLHRRNHIVQSPAGPSLPPSRGCRSPLAWPPLLAA